MLHRRITPVLLLAIVSLAACEPDSSALTSPPPSERAGWFGDEGEVLDFVVPQIVADDLVQRTYTFTDPDPDGAALADEIGDDDSQRPLQAIFSPRTEVGFEPGFAYAFGTHRYIGNLGSVQPTAHVAFNDQHLASRSVIKQDYVPFLADWGMVKSIWDWAKVFSDHECGLSVEGQSAHKAWWQFFQGRSAPLWGTVIRTTQDGIARQPGCQSGGNVQTGGVTTNEQTATGTVCYYYVTYVIATGQVISADLLYCNSAGGGTQL